MERITPTTEKEKLIKEILASVSIPMLKTYARFVVGDDAEIKAAYDNRYATLTSKKRRTKKSKKTKTITI